MTHCGRSRAAAPGSAVAVKVRGELVSPPTDAVAVCVPTMVPRVRIAVAMPAALVVDCDGTIVPPPNATAQLTGTLATGFTPSVTSTE